MNCVCCLAASISCYQCKSIDVESQYQCTEYMENYDLTPQPCKNDSNAAYCIKVIGHHEGMLLHLNIHKKHLLFSINILRSLIFFIFTKVAGQSVFVRHAIWETIVIFLNDPVIDLHLCRVFTPVIPMVVMAQVN